MGTSTADDTSNRVYLDGLGISATRLNGVTASVHIQSVCSQDYVNALNVEAATSRRLCGSNTADDDANRTYVDGLAVNATRLNDVDATQLDVKCLPHPMPVYTLFGGYTVSLRARRCGVDERTSMACPLQRGHRNNCWVLRLRITPKIENTSMILE